MNNVCVDCIGEEYLRNEIKQSGPVEQCDYCHSESKPVIVLDKLAERVHPVLQENYYTTSSGFWRSSGKPVLEVIMNLIHLSDSSTKLAEDIREYLSFQYGSPSDYDMKDDPFFYETDSLYEKREIDTYEFRKIWNSFCREILFRSRFFNKKAKDSLDHLFNGVEQLATHDGEPVVRVIDSKDSIFRARSEKPEESLENILKGAPESLGAPPVCCAKAGRMNAEGISVFYGATDIDTCIAEIRAPVGSYIAIGKFVPLRELCLLDLARLGDAVSPSPGSLFDAKYMKSLSRVRFLKWLQEDLAKPVMPGSETRDYVPTQVVAEYLAAYPDMQIDGVMFTSSQTTEEKQGKNVVLFSHACGLEKYDIPDGTEIEVGRPLHRFGNRKDSIMIREIVPATPESEGESSAVQTGIVPRNPIYSSASSEKSVSPSLRLDIENIEVRKIKGVTYNAYPYDVSRYRVKAGNLDF